MRLLKRHHVDSDMPVSFLLAAGAPLAFPSLASEVLEGETFAFDRWLLQAPR